MFESIPDERLNSIFFSYNFRKLISYINLPEIRIHDIGVVSEIQIIHIFRRIARLKV